MKSIPPSRGNKQSDPIALHFRIKTDLYKSMSDLNDLKRNRYLNKEREINLKHLECGRPNTSYHDTIDRDKFE